MPQIFLIRYKLISPSRLKFETLNQTEHLQNTIIIFSLHKLIFFFSKVLIFFWLENTSTKSLRRVVSESGRSSFVLVRKKETRREEKRRMGIRFILMVNKQGQTRLAQYYEYLTLEERRALEAEIVRKCLARNEQQVSLSLSLSLTPILFHWLLCPVHIILKDSNFNSKSGSIFLYLA